jgi:uncharacterized protein YndB with AHSA1/START domain
MTMADGTLVRLQVRRRFDAPPERVFDAWLDPATASRWLFATADGRMVRAEVDPRVGGAYNFTDRRDGVDVEHVGEYLEIDRPRRLAFTFAVPLYSTIVTRVTLDIAPSGDGSELTLTHEGVLPEYAGRTEEGWGRILETLESSLLAPAAEEGGPA